MDAMFMISGRYQCAVPLNVVDDKTWYERWMSADY